MITVYPKSKRFLADHGWLKSDHHFSFADYYDPANLQFGALRVFNDDWVDPGKGFGAHPHRDMEIVSIVLSGELQHQDSTGRKEVIRPGEVQYMCAGTGIVHSEINPSATEAVNFLQLWFLPERRGLEPVYEQRAYPQELLSDGWVQVLAPKSQEQREGHVIPIFQDVRLFLTKMSESQLRNYEVVADRRIYLYIIEGQVQLSSGETLGARDAVRMEGIQGFELKGLENSFVLLIDLA